LTIPHQLLIVNAAARIPAEAICRMTLPENGSTYPAAGVGATTESRSRKLKTRQDIGHVLLRSVDPMGGDRFITRE
jgi:hypothetical protein